MADLTLSPEQLQQIGTHLTACLPEEACGMVGGADRRAGLVLPVENALHSPVRFQMEPMAQFKAMIQIETAGMELLAIFHSHPNGPVHPSPTDVAEFLYPGTLVLIASPLFDDHLSNLEDALTTGNWQIRGFQINQGAILAVKLECSD